MTRLTIKVKQILKDIEPGGFILVEGPSPRVGVRKLDGTTAIMRQRRIVVGLDANGEAELNVEPGPLVVRIPYGVDRQRVYKVNIPNKPVANLADLIEEQGADAGDVKPPEHFVTRDELEALAETKANVKHTHHMLDINGLNGVIVGLQDDIGARAPLGHTHAKADVEGLTADLESLHAGVANSAPLQHKHTKADIDGLQDMIDTLQNGLALSAPREHKHAMSDIEGLVAKLEELANIKPPPAPGPVTPAPHTHKIDDIDMLRARLNAIDAALKLKAGPGHRHKIADVDGLQAELDGLLEALEQDSNTWQQAITNTRQTIYSYVEQQLKHTTYDLYAGWEDPNGWVQMKAQNTYNGRGTAWQPFSSTDGRRQVINATGYHCSGIRIAEEEAVLAEATYTSEDERTRRDRWSITAMTDNPDAIRVYVRSPKAETVSTVAATRIT